MAVDLKKFKGAIFKLTHSVRLSDGSFFGKGRHTVTDRDKIVLLKKTKCAIDVTKIAIAELEALQAEKEDLLASVKDSIASDEGK